MSQDYLFKLPTLYVHGACLGMMTCGKTLRNKDLLTFLSVFGLMYDSNTLRDVFDLDLISDPPTVCCMTKMAFESGPGTQVRHCAYRTNGLAFSVQLQTTVVVLICYLPGNDLM